MTKLVLVLAVIVIVLLVVSPELRQLIETAGKFIGTVAGSVVYLPEVMP
jgi:hypothetical protein